MVVFLDAKHHEVSKDPKHWEPLTKQSFRDEVDINQIIAGFMKTGLAPVRDGKPFYGDVSDIGDYRECLEHVREADELFNQMPADVRSKFGNDPAAMVDFLSDPANLDEAIELGLVVKRPDVEPIVAKSKSKVSKSQPKAEDKGDQPA